MMRRTLQRWIVLIGIGGFGGIGGAAQAEVLRFYGYAYDLKSQRYLYTEVHEQIVEDGQWKRGRVRYYTPDNRLISDKPLDFSANPFIPIYRFEIPAEQYLEAITAVSSTEVTMVKQADGKKRETKLLPLKERTAADAGFHAYIVAHFAELMAQQTVEFNFMVAGNLDVYRFRARRMDDTRFEGRPAVRFKVDADSMLRLVAPALELTYDPETKALLEYRGISNVHDPATGKAYTARIAYLKQTPADAPKQLPPLVAP